ncbi:MAG: sulfur carrier protein ThiS [Bacteroidales bacterium]|nr:sulfur carrier protein ThiS [Bacteroidales bacterium]
MKITVNDEEIEFAGQTVADLSKQLSLPDKGVAVAVDMQMVPRAQWPETNLSDGQKIIIIKAVSGG